MSEPKFIVDLNAGRQVEWLRITGYDTTFVPGIEDGRLVSLAQEEGRILVARDRNTMRRRLSIGEAEGHPAGKRERRRAASSGRR